MVRRVFLLTLPYNTPMTLHRHDLGLTGLRPSPNLPCASASSVCIDSAVTSSRHSPSWILAPLLDATTTSLPVLGVITRFTSCQWGSLGTLLVRNVLPAYLDGYVSALLLH